VHALWYVVPACRDVAKRTKKGGGGVVSNLPIIFQSLINISAQKMLAKIFSGHTKIFLDIQNIFRSYHN
jgi:hypothetical protein